MKGTLMACAAAVLVAGGGRAADKDKDKKIDPAKLVGKWEISKTEDTNAPPKGTVIEFTKDNKITMTAELDGKKIEFAGTYKVDGDKLTIKMSLPGGKDVEDTDTIQSLTDDKLVTVDKEKKTTELTKKK